MLLIFTESLLILASQLFYYKMLCYRNLVKLLAASTNLKS